LVGGILLPVKAKPRVSGAVLFSAVSPFSGSMLETSAISCWLFNPASLGFTGGTRPVVLTPLTAYRCDWRISELFI